MTNFEVIMKNHPQYVKEVLAHNVCRNELRKVAEDKLDHFEWYNSGINGDVAEMNFLNEEYVKSPVLDKIEKEYLSNVIRPFRSRIEYISKIVDWVHRCFIVIYLKTNGRQEQICLPRFSENSNMYKGMAFEKLYTLDDLGL